MMYKLPNEEVCDVGEQKREEKKGNQVEKRL